MHFRVDSVSENPSRQPARLSPHFPSCFRSVRVSAWNCCRQSDDQSLAADSSHPADQMSALARKTAHDAGKHTLMVIQRKTRGMEVDLWGT